MGPQDLSRWSTIWFKCQDSVKSQFLDFKYEFWNHERTSEFVKEQFPQYYDNWTNISLDIIKIDIVRMMILYKYGGIYLDLDVYCYKNFYNELCDDICLVGTFAERSYRDNCENFLMAGIPGHEFWLKSVELAFSRYKEFTPKDLSIGDGIPFLNINSDAVNYISGNINVTDLYMRMKNSFQIHLLPYEYYNPNYLSYDECFRTKHMSTLVWGKEYIDNTSDIDLDYKNFKFIPTDLCDFDFYKNYSNTTIKTLFPHLLSIHHNFLTYKEKNQISQNLCVEGPTLDRLNNEIEIYAENFKSINLQLKEQAYCIMSPEETIHEDFETNFIVGILLPDIHTGFLEVILHNPITYLFGLSGKITQQGKGLSEYCYGFYSIPGRSGNLILFPSWIKFSLKNLDNHEKKVIILKIEFN